MRETHPEEKLPAGRRRGKCSKHGNSQAKGSYPDRTLKLYVSLKGGAWRQNAKGPEG